MASFHKIMGKLTAVAYAEICHGGVAFSGICWWFAFGVRCLWRHNLTSYSYFQTTFWRRLLT